MSSSYYWWNTFGSDQADAQDEERRFQEEAQRIAEQERLKHEWEKTLTLPPVTVTADPYDTNNPYDNPFYSGFDDVGPQPNTPPPQYDNPFQGPVPTPGPITYGPTPDMPLLPVTTDPTIIGAIDPKTGLPYRHDPDPVPLEDKDKHPEDPMGPNNPTIYPPGGLLGSGVDVGVPGLISLGGLLGAGGGLLGLGGDMGVGGSGGSGQTTNQQQPVTGPVPVGGSSGGQTLPSSDGGLNRSTPGVPPPPADIITPSQTITLPAILPQPPSNPPPSNPPPPPPPAETPNDTLTLPPSLGGGGLLEATVNENQRAVTVPVVPTTPPPPIQPGPITPNPPSEPNDTVTVPPPISPPPPVTPPPVVPPPVTPPPSTPPPSQPPPTTPVPTTPLPLPLDRNYYREGSQTNQDNASLLPSIFQNYASTSGSYGQQDMANFAGLLQSLGITNQQLTGMANQQTAAGNTALRTGNVTDAGNLGGQALGILQQLNPNMYGALNRTNTAAGATGSPSDIQMTLEQQAREGLALGGQLSAEDNRLAQQAAREAWSARGLVNSPGAVAEEVLNRDSLARQRLAERQALASAVDQQGFSQRQQGFGNQIQNSLLQMQGAFDPFKTVTSANTQNQGSNQQLFSQGAGFSSGAFGNQNVNNLVNPFNPYSQDVYNSNFNAGNARFISQGNNAAALAGARDAASGDIANSFLRLIGQIYGAS